MINSFIEIMIMNLKYLKLTQVPSNCYEALAHLNKVRNLWTVLIHRFKWICSN